MTVIFACFEGESTSPTTMLVIGVVLVAIGALLLFESFRRLRQARVVAHISETPVGKLAPGPVRVFGRIEGDNPLVSPLTGSPCFYYESHAEKCHESGESENWSTIRSDTARRDFHLNDGTGRVLVQPDRAEFDLPSTLEASLRPGATPSCKIDPLLGLPALTEQEMRALIQWDWKSPRSAAIAAGTEQEQHAEHKRKWWAPESIEVAGFEVGLSSEIRKFRLTETCLHAGREYSIVATCESASDQDGHPSLVLKRGAEQTTFVISSERGAGMARSLRKKALLIMIAGLFFLAFGIIALLTRHSWVVG